MDFLGIGVAELFFIFVIALMVLGPRRLPEYAAKAGKLVRDLRNMSQGLMIEWQREIAVATRIEELEETRRELQEAQKTLRETNQLIRSEARQTASETSKVVAQTSKAISDDLPPHSPTNTPSQKQDPALQDSPDSPINRGSDASAAENRPPVEPTAPVSVESPPLEPPDSIEIKPVNGSTKPAPSPILPSSEPLNES